jgi:hypothetical protein
MNRGDRLLFWLAVAFVVATVTLGGLEAIGAWR